MSSRLVRRVIPLYITAICGAVVLLGYFLNIGVITTASTQLTAWGAIIGPWALLISFGSILRVQIVNVRRRAPGKWYFSILALLLGAISSIVGWFLGLNSNQFNWIYNTLILPLGNAHFAIFGFTITYVSYRGLRAKTRDSIILLICAVILILTNAPIGDVIWPGFAVIGNWLLLNANTSVMRATTLGSAMAAITLGLRVILGKEKQYLMLAKEES